MPESKRWTPGHWSDYKVRMFTKHVLSRARRAAEEMHGPYAGRLVAAELSAAIGSNASRAMLNQRGVKTLGEV